ncbi:MAG: phosphatidate cytidylyltransferase [Spirochaetota bacterium]
MEQILGIYTDIRSRGWATELRTELLRKSIHLLIALVPSLASWNFGFTVALLGSGMIVYSYCELMRLNGYDIVVISRITALAARKRDAGRFVYGPVTLGIGAMMALVLYPEPAAAIAIYALAFGDGLSSLVGRSFGTLRLPFTGGKSLEGSLTCFIAVASSTYAISGNTVGSIAVAIVATVVEALPTKDLDNILLPCVTGLAAMLILFV